jgi:hypothetical protein
MANEFKHKDPGAELTSAEFIAACGDGHIFACQATGDIAYASSATVLSKLGKGAAGTILNMGGSCIPAWNASPSFTALTLSGALDVNGTIDYDGTDVDMLSSGDIDLVSSNDAAAAVYIAQSTGTSGTVKIHADTGTSVTEGAESINILSDVGGVGIRSTANLANAVNITVDGGTTSTMTLFNDQGTSVTEGAASIALVSDAGGVELRSTANLANAINLTSDGGTAGTITLFNDQGTAVNEGVASIQLLSDVGGIGIKSGLNAAGAIRLTADAGTSETIAIHADQGNTTASICLTSDAGGITLNPGTFVTVGANATNAAEVRMFEDTDNGCNYVALKAPNVSTSYTITLPTAVAASCGLFLKSTCAGVTSWAAAGGGGPTISDVTSTQTRTESTSFMPTTISHAVSANEDWCFQINLLYNSNSTADVKLEWSGIPSGASGNWSALGYKASGAFDLQSNVSLATDITAGGQGAVYSIFLYGVFIVGGSGGTLQLDFAQNTANASDTTIEVGSYGIFHKIR